MKTHFDIEELVKSGSINNELDYQRALLADRKLRLLSKEDSQFKTLRLKLRDLIEKYEKSEWNNVENISDKKVLESDKYESLANAERLFIEKRKQELKKKLKEYNLTQEDLATILGHKSKTYMSELMNGITPFTLTDLVIIRRLLGIDFKELIPPFLPIKHQLKLKESLQKVNNPKIKLKSKNLALV